MMARVWLLGSILLAACSFDAVGLGTSITADPATTSTGTDALTTTTAPPTTGTPSTGTTADDGTATTLEVTLTGTSGDTGSSSGDPSTGTSTGTGTGTSTGTSSGSTGTSSGSSSTGDASSSTTTTSDASSSSSGSSSTTGPVEGCEDGAKNGAETDIDCGGPSCPACPDGSDCDVDGDCESLICALEVCVVPACDDGVQNGDESDLDCGGPDCGGCGLGLACGEDSDCDSGICGPDGCVATLCEDAEKNGQETGIDCGGDCPACVTPVINEVDYDQLDADTLEFVELHNNTAAPIALAGIQLVLVNGANKAPYLTIDLGPAGTLKADGYLVVRVPGVVVAPGALVLDFALPAGNVQNGSPDGVAVVDTIHEVLGDALSYEGEITQAMLPPLGVVSLVEGAATPVADIDDTPASLVRLPNGVDTDDALTDWKLSATPTPGAANLP